MHLKLVLIQELTIGSYELTRLTLTIFLTWEKAPPFSIYYML